MDKQEFYKAARSDIKGPLDGVRVVAATTMWDVSYTHLTLTTKA